jgi:hypothetical protein
VVTVTDASFRQSRRKDVRGMIERQVQIPNPDGTTTVHRFWTDSHDAPARVAWASEISGPTRDITDTTD